MGEEGVEMMYTYYLCMKVTPIIFNWQKFGVFDIKTKRIQVARDNRHFFNSIPCGRIGNLLLSLGRNIHEMHLKVTSVFKVLYSVCKVLNF